MSLGNSVRRLFFTNVATTLLSESFWSRNLPTLFFSLPFIWTNSSQFWQIYCFPSKFGIISEAMKWAVHMILSGTFSKKRKYIFGSGHGRQKVHRRILIILAAQPGQMANFPEIIASKYFDLWNSHQYLKWIVIIYGTFWLIKKIHT